MKGSDLDGEQFLHLSIELLQEAGVDADDDEMTADRFQHTQFARHFFSFGSGTAIMVVVM